MVAAICSWHEHHDRAAGEIQRRLERREKMIVAAHALIETYAVLTRLPPPHRLPPETAYALIRSNFMDAITIIALDLKNYLVLLRAAPQKGVAGGRTYDEVIAACAVKAKVNTLLTFNDRHFENGAGGVLVVVPGAK
jgi:predicted nucleic acid-binding protein